ncbi:MAG TPA: SGNH/GDSL hydrolase family protein [bacterium]|uniref:SGNH hydrolase-type esterase domain-containing protein n=1 Tax=candidate division TA06 bacterium ADurb.Bin417 TaxID=1852828 RepID=A0A1V5MIC5_UNCT6|nr:MAG: hypothetical protein BWY73_00548 [candidate division TA06 bacterium ADurb.Bin417]HNQ35569.1 SGNH/GDSL hydrolase family protein [bacterium]HNS48317.1 SGNH/GDSL hydrolase family protein [bacterium]
MLHRKAELYNVAEMIDLEAAGDRVLSRLPDALRRSLNPHAVKSAPRSAGCEIRFNLKGEQARVVIEHGSEKSLVEVYRGPFLSTWHPLTPGRPCEISVGREALAPQLKDLAGRADLSYDPDLVRIILPHLGWTRLLELEGDLAPPRPEQTPARRCLMYGSSITHGYHGIRPSGSYAMLTARRLGVDLINLGFGGGAWMEPQLADYIAGRTDWDFAILEMGINVIREMEAADFEARVDYFIARIAAAHPEKWLFCIDVFSFRDDFDPALAKPELFRQAVRRTVRRVNSKRVVHLDGRRLLTDFGGLTTDLVHPSPDGMAEMADRLAGAVSRRMEKPV